MQRVEIIEIEVAPDQGLQAELLGPARHPATNSLTLLSKLIAELTKPGDFVIDPMAGSGSTGLLAARAGRDALCLDCEPELVESGRARWGVLASQTSILPYGEFRFQLADATLSWPTERKANAVIFSPPFLSALPSDGRPTEQWDSWLPNSRNFNGTRSNLGRTYGPASCNIGALDDLFPWAAAMHDVLIGAAEALAPGGVVAVIMRDLVRAGRVIELTSAISHQLEGLGLELFAVWIRQLTHLSMFTRMREKRGELVVKEEYVVLARASAGGSERARPAHRQQLVQHAVQLPLLPMHSVAAHQG